ncbi:S9 family peptidase [Colwellia hornerae]|uniref:S9 family peptidase n=1 Tax=Colwellia hornerae TaxID=89402 RepID=A0A5C6QFA1_9GAMM|nr:S9 family peptidase [Colwellia hornerae]TWX52595.1 S9 family peptidase [Colwellia hornerae]TWX58358.1 S9 family peptidase [Colwellia hornerae]TWX67410.1 S9 family peptidase [Colwellia hornerae]
MIKFPLLITTICTALLLFACSKPAEEVVKQAVIEEKTPVFETYSAEEFFKTTSVSGSSINADASAVLISNDKTGIFNAYKMPLDGSAPIQLTQSTLDSVFGVSWFPKDDRILYTADKGGDELDHLYVRELSGSITDLTPGKDLKAYFLSWHEDNKQFFVASNERDPKFFDVYRYQNDDYSRELIYRNGASYSVESISPNGQYIALSKTNSNADSNLYLADLTKADELTVLITDHQGDVEHSAYTFTGDSKQLIYSTDEFGEYKQAWAYDIKAKTKTLNYAADWDVSFTYFSKDGRYQVTGVNADAQTKIEIIDLKTKHPLALPKLPSGDLRGVNFSADASLVIFYINSDTSPSNLYVHQLGSNSIKRLTNTGNPNIIEENLVVGEIVRFKSFDGLEIPGILYKPKQAATQKVPALVWIHGGPGGQSRKGYSATIQHLVNNGYAIFRINNRGSSGYGKTFFHLDDKKHGDHDLKDVVYNKYYLQTLDWVDKDRIGVIGGSYGGYLTMAAMAFTDEFTVGVNIFGVTNWVRTLESIPPYWEAFRQSLYDELGDPSTDRERLRSISPVFFGDKVKSPVLVVQGKNDPRVLKIESDEMVESIRSGGTFVDYLVFDDEGHGFSKKANRIEASNKYLSFFKTYL